MENQFNLGEYINGDCIDPSKDKQKIIASNRKELELEEEQKKFFIKDDRKFAEDFPYLSKLLGVLKVLHSALEIILELKESGEKVNDKKEKNKLLKQVRGVFRKLYDASDSKHETGVSSLMLKFARLVNIMSDNLLIEVLILIIYILRQILKILIDTIEKSSKEDCIYYEMWAKLASKGFSKIARNPAFQAALTVAASSSVAVIGANIGLTALGFTVSGVQAGSIAATWMSVIGVVGKGSLFAALQSAGVVGIGAAATGGIAIVGGIVGFGIFGVVKLATMETKENVKVIIISRETKSVLNEINVNFSSKMKLKYFLIEKLPQNVLIPNDVNQIGVKLKKDGKSLPIPYSSLKKKATDVFGFVLFGPKSLEVFEKTSSNTSLELPFYLQRTGKDTWKIVENQPSSWN